MNKYILAFAVVLFLVYGCTQASDFAKLESPSFITVNYSNFTNPVNASCSCMFCTSMVVPTAWYDFWTPDTITYFGGNCSVETCTPAIVQAKLADKNTDVKTYMLGVGTGFADFDFGNSYCKNGMDMAVKWQYDPSGTHTYPIPEFDRAKCMLQNNVIPVYVMYSNGSKGTIQSGLVRLGMVAKTLAGDSNGTGPVIITTEMNSDPEYAEAVANQAFTIRSFCKNCLIAIAPKMGDVDTLDKIMKYANQKKIADRNGVVRAPVDMIAVGVDSAFYNGSCNPQQLLYFARNFSAYAMYKYNITSVWPYMLIREGTMNTGKEILNCQQFKDETSCQLDTRKDFCKWDGFSCLWKEDISLKYCRWEDGANTRMFSDFFLTEMAASLNDGVVGAAAYSVTGAVNPLNVSTAIGLFDQTLPITKQVQSTDPRFSHFFGFCAVYASDYLSSDGNKNKFDNRYRIIVPQDNWNRAIPVYETDVAGNPVIDQTTGKPKIKTETNPITGKVTAVTTDHVVSLVSCPSVFQNTRFSWLMGVENASTKYVVGYNPSTGEAITGQQLTASQYKEKSSVLNMQPFEPDALNDWNNLPKPLFKCDYCVKAIGDAVPGTKDTGSGLSGSTDYATWCNAFPQIDSYADYFDIDPWLVRAIMRHETGFGGANYDAERARCTVAVVAKDQATLDKYCKTFDASGTKCKYASYTSPTTGKSIPIFPGDFGCYDYTHAYNVKNLGDPDGVCANVQGVYLPTTAPDCTDINTDPSLCKATVTNDPLPDDLAYCAYGLTAVIEHPYYDWSDTQTGGKSFTPQQVSEVCGSKYNPLNATDAICWGTYKIKLSWVSSEATVDTHITKGDYFGTEAKNDENIRRRYIASLVIEKNRGLFCGKGKPASQCVEYWIGNYNQIKDGNGAGLCNKITYETTVDQDGKKTTTPKIEDVSGKVIDFPSYLANCAPDDQYGTRKYSEKILNMYNSLISGCSRSDCPYGRLSENRKQP